MVDTGDQSKMQAPEKPKVLIIGAGPAGAALAQILRKNNVAFELFERDDKINARTGGGFALDSCLPALEAALPDDMGSILYASANSPIGQFDTINVIDGITGQTHHAFGGPRGDPQFYLHTQRARLIEWLTQKIDVRVGKKFERYEEDDTGVTAFFADGTSARGTLLVAADGAGSRVRAQLLDNPHRKPFDYLPITGEVVLRRAEYAAIDALANGALLAASTHNFSFLVRLDVAPDGSWARYWWLQIIYAPEGPEQAARWLQTASRQELYDCALENAAKHVPIFADTIRLAGPESVWQPQILFSEWSPPDSFPTGKGPGGLRRVTLMGDAAHNTTPFGAMGANTSMRDAVDLAAQIVAAEKEKDEALARGDWARGWHNPEKLAEILKAYEGIMIPRGQQIIRAAGNAASDYLHAPFIEARLDNFGLDESGRPVSETKMDKGANVVTRVISQEDPLAEAC